jgi:DNA-binding GntR family transcriptional regulator
MTKSKSSTLRHPPSSTLHERAYAEIRRQILNSQLLPDEPLSEYDLAVDLKMSRTPVREALKRLGHEGLVRFVLNRGAFVSSLSVSDVAEIYQVREQLEGFAAFVAAEKMSGPEITALEQELANAEKLAGSGRIAETFESDINLHQCLVLSTQNNRIAGILETLADQVHRIRVLSPNTPGRLEATLREHGEILSCVKRRDKEAARAAMVRHLHAAQENALRLLMMPSATRRQR